MSTVIRPEVSKRNEYWIPKHRYYELKHFCLQYNDWLEAYNSIELYYRSITGERVSRSSIADPVFTAVDKRLYFKERIDMVKKAAILTDNILSSYILEAVTNDLGYTYLKSRLAIPCSKDVYYELYRKFFYILNELRK